jgi:ABC-type lipoprotein release transport system permease subunit
MTDQPTNLSLERDLSPGPLARAAKAAGGFGRAILRLIGTLFVIGFSLLPLSALLVALPAVSPNEAVLTDTVQPARSRWRRGARRLFAAVAGVVVLVALVAFGIEVVSRLPLPPGGQMATLAKKVFGLSFSEFPIVSKAVFPEDVKPDDLPSGTVWLSASELLDKRKALQQAAGRSNLDIRDRREALEKLAAVEAEINERSPKSARLRLLLDSRLAPVLAEPLWKLLPPALVDHWPFVFLIVYGTDLVLLLVIGKVPLAYNFRYLWVRRRDTALTAVAFTVVVALVVVLLAFVNGMYKLNETTGVPGNVLVMSEGSTDELFSNLARGGEIDNAIKSTVAADSKGRPIGPGGKGVNVGRVTPNADGSYARVPADAPKDLPDARYLASYESYLVLNQQVATKPGEPQKRRFVQLRAFLDPGIGGAVHNITLDPGGRWFTPNAVEPGDKAPDGLQYLQCCIGEGAAATLGEDAGKPRLVLGDTFQLADRWWKVIGLMHTRGTTYGSEIWTGNENPVVRETGKGDKFTTLVLRMEDNSDDSAKAMAFFLTEVYQQAKLKAFSEPDYYKELTKTNEQFLTAIVMMAVIMAVGGIFGVMNTMFASIAARMKEVGVLRILGFKRWQILISFMIESLAIAFVGGLLGCLLGYFANGFEAASTLSGGQGGGKSVTLQMQVDTPIIAAGLLFTLVMGRLGGLVPALSAMRMEILESLR